jgi:hypothetical protein
LQKGEWLKLKKVKKTNAESKKNFYYSKLEQGFKPVNVMIPIKTKRRFNHWKYTLKLTQSEFMVKAIAFFDEHYEKIEEL